MRRGGSPRAGNCAGKRVFADQDDRYRKLGEVLGAPDIDAFIRAIVQLQKFGTFTEEEQPDEKTFAQVSIDHSAHMITIRLPFPREGKLTYEASGKRIEVRVTPT